MNCMCGGETDHSPPHRSTERCGGDWSVVTKHPWPMRSTNQTSGHQTSNHQPSSAGLLLFECATRIEGVQPTRSSAGLLPFECACHCSNRRSPTDDGMWICQFQSWIIRSSGELVCFQVNQLVIRGNATSLSNADLAGTENTSSASPVAHLNKCSFLFPPPLACMIALDKTASSGNVLPDIVQRHARCSQDGVNPAVPRRLAIPKSSPSYGARTTCI